MLVVMGFSNVYQILHSLGCKSALVDKDALHLVKSVHGHLRPALKIDFTCDTLTVEDCYHLEVFLSSDLRKSYDIGIVSGSNKVMMTPIYYLCRYLLVVEDFDAKHKTLTYLPFKLLDSSYGQQLYINPFKSVGFDSLHPSPLEDTYLRDTSTRFMNMVVDIGNTWDLLGRNQFNIVALCSLRKQLQHAIETSHQECCTVDPHPIHHLQRIARSCIDVYAQDEYSLSVFKRDVKAKKIDNVRVTLKQATTGSYEDIAEGIDLLYLDVHCDEKDQASLASRYVHLYNNLRDKMTYNSIIVVEGTDLGKGAKTSTLIPVLMRYGYMIICRGRQSVFIKCHPERLWQSV